MYAPRINRPRAVALHHASGLLELHPIDWENYPGLTEGELEEAEQYLTRFSKTLLAHANSAGWATEKTQIENP